MEEDDHRVLRVEVDRLPSGPERTTWLSNGFKDALSGAMLSTEKEDEDASTAGTPLQRNGSEFM